MDPGQKAFEPSDLKDGRNSFFTAALLEQLRKQGDATPIQTIMIAVATSMEARIAFQQRMWVVDSCVHQPVLLFKVTTVGGRLPFLAIDHKVSALLCSQIPRAVLAVEAAAPVTRKPKAIIVVMSIKAVQEPTATVRVQANTKPLRYN